MNATEQIPNAFLSSDGWNPSSNLPNLRGIFLITFLSLIFFSPIKYSRLPGIPVVGRSFRWEPELLTRYRFSLNGWSIIHNGWLKNPETPYTIVRPGANLTVLPRKYVRELQSLPESQLYPILAIVEDLMGWYTKADILLGSHLAPQAVKTKLTPRLGNFAEIFQQEVDLALPREMPECSEWTTVDFNKIALGFVGRVTARLFVGEPLCRDDEWLRLNVNFVKEIFKVVVILRHTPSFFVPFMGILVRTPFQRYLRRIHNYIVPLISERRRKYSSDSKERPDDMLQWMMDMANKANDEAEAPKLATRYSWTIVGSIFTVTAAIVDCMYDLCARPEYFKILEEECSNIVPETGFNQETGARLQKMDSFMKEVQRMNPPSALGFKRIVMSPITLSDGLQLPKDTYICVPTTTYQQDIIDFNEENPAVFNGLRYYHKRQDPGYRNRHQYASTDPTHIHFGTGRWSCPGRAVASLEIKIILAKLLRHYEWRFHEGQTRPQNRSILELSFQDPSARVQVRRKL